MENATEPVWAVLSQVLYSECKPFALRIGIPEIVIAVRADLLVSTHHSLRGKTFCLRLARALNLTDL